LSLLKLGAVAKFIAVVAVVAVLALPSQFVILLLMVTG